MHLKHSTTKSSNNPHSGQPQPSSKNINDPWKQALSDLTALAANTSNDVSAEIPAPNHTEGKPFTSSTVKIQCYVHFLIHVCFEFSLIHFGYRIFTDQSLLTKLIECTITRILQ